LYNAISFSYTSPHEGSVEVQGLMKMNNPIDLPDRSDVSHERGYSAAAGTLAHARAFLDARKLVRTAELERVTARLKCLASKPMSRHQRLALRELLGRAANAGEACDLDLAITSLNQALQLAKELRDAPASARCMYHLGCVQRGRRGKTHHAQAAKYFADSLAIIERLRDSPATECAGATAAASLELDVLCALAGQEFLLAHYEAAEQHLAAAGRLADTAPEPRLGAATLLWVSALIQRWQGEPTCALASAAQAADILHAARDRRNAGRLQSVIAEIALDLAETFSADPSAAARRAFTTMAGTCVERAQRLAHETGDAIGIQQANLYRARHSRMCHRSEDRRTAIDTVLRYAEKHGDSLLATQAYTSLGHELEANGDRGSATNTYRKALKAAEQSGAPAYTVWPLRELRRAEELCAS
jgi:tetratricopeptide (TPR) repeat protein